MGKNNIENSLKHFLKKKVKITLGFVVAFMISGTVGFAADSTTTVGEHNKNFEGLSIAEKFLAGRGTTEINIDNEITAGSATISSDNGEIKIKFGTNEPFKIEKDKISAITGKVIQNSLDFASGETVSEESLNIDIEGYKDGLNKNNMNKGITTNAQMIESGIGYNYGIIANIQGITGTGIGYNYGIIVNNNNKGQSIVNNGIGNNYGIIANSGEGGQWVSNKNAVANNYGIIANTSKKGQEIISGIGNNYGVICNLDESGQLVNTGGIANNYGIIDNKKNYGQRAYDGKVYNYGIIENDSNYGQSVEDRETNEAYNYGLIANNGDYAINNIGKGTAVNYGVVKNKTGNVFLGNVTNYGIVILIDEKNQTIIGDRINNGIVLGHDYELLEGYKTDVKVFEKDEMIKGFGNNNSFGENITKGFVKDTTVKIDNTEGKVIGAVVTEKAQMNGSAVFNYEGDDLFLKDTSLVGYFEQDGTLLDVGTGNLTLGGDTNITAVKNDMNLDVYAVKLGDNGKITIMDEAKINGIIKGNDNSEITFTQAKGVFDVDGGKVSLDISNTGQASSDYQKYFSVTLTADKTDNDGDKVGNTVDEIEINTENAVANLTNRLTIEDGVTVNANADGNSIYDTNTTNTDAELEITVNNIHNIKGNVSLGVGKDTFIVTNNDNHTDEHLKTEIDLGAGDDKFVVVGNAVDDKGESKNIFSYNVVNAETIELRGGTWGDWNDAKGTIKFTDSTKAGKQPNLLLGNGTTMNITLGTENQGSDFAKYVAEDLELSHAVITGTGNGSAIKYLINEKTGLDMAKLTSYKYSFDKEKVEVKSAIFNVDTSKGNSTTVTVKTAEEMGLSGEDRIIYHAYLNQIKAGNANAQVIGQINSYNSSEEFAKLIRQTSVTGEAYYTAGSTLTKDITNSYLSSVEDFTKRAGKGEWLAQGKYINSDTEFDGGKKVKGYDGDITGTVGMIEYGVTENTSYGAVFGMGDAEMDIQGGGKLDGDNTYFGAYMKHRTQNGIELVGNIGYMKSEMDSVLRNDFNFSNNTADEKHPVNTNGKTFEDGTANSSAVVIGLKGRKDYRISDSVKLQPTLGARLTFINQEEAENPEMHFTIVEQDIIVVEGTAGMGIAKEFALSEGKFELNTGFEYTFAAANSNNDARYKVFDEEHPLEDVEAAENTGKIYFSADYEHENGVGFNGKYEMMWSDKGDDSRITAGVSYRF